MLWNKNSSTLGAERVPRALGDSLDMGFSPKRRAACWKDDHGDTLGRGCLCNVSGGSSAIFWDEQEPVACGIEDGIDSCDGRMLQVGAMGWKSGSGRKNC